MGKESGCHAAHVAPCENLNGAIFTVMRSRFPFDLHVDLPTGMTTDRNKLCTQHKHAANFPLQFALWKNRVWIQVVGDDFAFLFNTSYKTQWPRWLLCVLHTIIRCKKEKEKYRQRNKNNDRFYTHAWNNGWKRLFARWRTERFLWLWFASRQMQNETKTQTPTIYLVCD